MELRIKEETLNEFFNNYKNERFEKGGLGFGVQKNDVTFLLSICIFEQVRESNVYCEIDGQDLANAALILSDLNEKNKLTYPIKIVSWVHTHPNLDIFLSGIDKDTLKNFNNLCENFIALVIDPKKNKYGAWIMGKDEPEKIKCTIFHGIEEIYAKDVEEVEQFLKNFSDLLQEKFKSLKRPLQYITSSSAIKLEEIREKKINLKDFHKKVLKKRRKSIFLKKKEGEAFCLKNLYKDSFLKGSSETYIYLCKNKPPFFKIAIPSKDTIFESSNLPEILRIPMMKSIDGEIVGYESGIRSALIFDEIQNIIYRLKGCGAGYRGFLKEEKCHKHNYVEIRGCQFQRTCLREQIMTSLLKDKLKEYNISLGNSSLGYWIYFEKSELIPYCGLFETVGDLRLKEDIIFSLEKGINNLIDKPNLKNWSPSKINSIIIYDKKPINLKDIDYDSFAVSVNKIEELIEKCNFENELKDELKFIFVNNSINLANLYWKLGTQIGKIRKVLDGLDFAWGTFIDPNDGELHCNSHPDNFVLNINEEQNILDLSIVDFDFSFNKETFIENPGPKNKCKFDEILRMEKHLLRRELTDYSFISTHKPIPKIEEEYEVIKQGLIETMVSGYDYGYDNDYSEKLTLEEVAFLLLCAYYYD